MQRASSLTNLNGKPLIVLAADAGHVATWQSARARSPSVLLGQLKMTEFLYLGHLRLEAENARISGPIGAETAQRSHSSPRLRRPQPSGPWSGCTLPAAEKVPEPPADLGATG